MWYVRQVLKSKTTSMKSNPPAQMQFWALDQFILHIVLHKQAGHNMHVISLRLDLYNVLQCDKSSFQTGTGAALVGMQIEYLALK